MFKSLMTASAILGVLVPVTAVAEDPVSIGPLDLSRRIVATSGAVGEDSAGYVRIRSETSEPDALLSVSCPCAERVEFHRIKRGPDGASMEADTAWIVPGQGALEVRPGSDLHLMLIGFDPARSAAGRVTLTLTFRDAGVVDADFALTGDSRAAWGTFD